MFCLDSTKLLGQQRCAKAGSVLVGTGLVVTCWWVRFGAVLFRWPLVALSMAATDFYDGGKRDAIARTRTQMRSTRTGVWQPVGHRPALQVGFEAPEVEASILIVEFGFSFSETLTSVTSGLVVV